MKPQLEKILRPVQGSFSAFHFQDKKFDAPWHFHPEFELTCILKSTGMRYVGDSVMEFEKGDLVLLGSNLPHCWKNTEHQKEEAESIVVQWHTDVLGQGWLAKTEFIAIRKLLKNASRGIRFFTATTDEVLPELQRMLDLPPFEKIIAFLQLLQRLANEKEYELLSGDNFSVTLNQGSTAKIDLIQNYVSANYHRQLTLTEVAKLVGMSEETFCRFFKRTFNKSFFTFLNEYKVKLACKELIETQKQVSEIAFLCGYESLPFFYRQFKKFIGCSPLVYQKKYQRVFS